MAPKKPKAKAKTSAEKAAEAAEEAEANEAKRIWLQRKNDGKWAQAQLEALGAQRQAAAKDGCDWLVEPHKWHEAQLARLVACLESKRIDGVSQGLREGVGAYVAQCAQAASDEVRSGVLDDRELYAELPEAEPGAYVRAAVTHAEEAVIAQIKAWPDPSAESMEEFVTVVRALPTSASVQEAGLVRLGGFLHQFSSETGKRKSGAEGLSATSLMSFVAAAMTEHLRDADVQRRGCAVIRGFALMDGQLSQMLEEGGAKLLVAAVNSHARVPDVVKTGNAAMEAMAEKAEIGSRDLDMMRAGGVHHERK
mmetsp:Transcript_4316/g.6888  ORF Transcript_4316/g.6888 Transcript_4316/m.6888 type:complete len:309 (-) Transcript_4316:50-976(-)